MPRIESEAMPPRMPRSEPLPRNDPMPRNDPSPRGDPISRGEPVPRSEPMIARPSRQSDAPKMPPVRAPEADRAYRQTKKR